MAISSQLIRRRMVTKSLSMITKMPRYIVLLVSFVIQINAHANIRFANFVCQNPNGTSCCRKDAGRERSNVETIRLPASSCPISLSNPEEDSVCHRHRQSSIREKQKYYKLTTKSGIKTIEFPWGEQIPFLNQTLEAVKGYTLQDDIDSKWIKSFVGLTGQIKEVTKKHVLKNWTFDALDDYKDIYQDHVKNIQDMKELKYISNPATENTFTPFLDNDSWLSDDFFVQQRLAGPCPFLLKLVTIGNESIGMKWGILKSMLNPKYDFGYALNRALNTTGLTLEEAVLKKTIYVLYEDDSDGIRTKAQDSFHSITNKELEQVTSPITLLSTTESGELKLIAIQMNHTKDSDVFSPTSDEQSWLRAKSMVNLVEQNYCQAVWHLSHVHFSSSVYCNIFRSHFSDLHPLHHIMQYHCEGTTPHIALSWQVLGPSGPIDQFSSIGNEGVIDLMLKGKQKYHYGLLAYDEILKKRGLGSDQIKYYPFRDDGAILWRAFQSFAKDFVGLFYASDAEVLKDEELQSFGNEVSAAGTKGPYGGRGGVVGFPSSFQTRAEVELFVTRFIWLVAMHAAVNYPMEPWYTFTPLSPTKLYKQNSRNEEHDFASALPDAPTTIGYLTYLTTLGNIRINKIMDHVDKIRQEELRTLIRHHHDHLHTTVQKKLELRNAQRRNNGKMGFQYFEPKWLTNSIHI